MQFYFIRHGQSENNLLWHGTDSSVRRSEDPELTRVGRQQAETLAQFLTWTAPTVAAGDANRQNVAGFGFTHLYTSLMVRAVATGTIVARALDLSLVTWEDAHETGGIYDKDEHSGERIGQAGRNRAYFEAHYPDLILPESLGEAGWWNRPFEESEQRRVRAQRFLSDLLERHGHTEDRVAVISHAGFYNQFLRVLLELPQESDCWFALNNTAITRIDFHAEHILLVYTNRADFLPREFVT
jgi:2,3-bisphosphoglycerate-dependent phosphoglycerate mutase